MTDIQWYGTAVLRLVVAGLCGALIGWERELREKGAGLRTHILISMGACLFILVGLRMYGELQAGDPLRLVHGLLLGVGFIAGGVIFTERGSVRGLTTAAGLWVLSAVGLACGLGYYVLAAVAAVITMVIIAGLKRLEVRMHGGGPEPNSDEPPQG